MPFEEGEEVVGVDKLKAQWSALAINVQVDELLDLGRAIDISCREPDIERLDLSVVPNFHLGYLPILMTVTT
jgi:hypothetical protein